MSRRDTIIISVLVNAALLAVLFITAVTSKNTVKEERKPAVCANLEETAVDAKELFSANNDNNQPDMANQGVFQEAQKEFVSLIKETQNEVKKEEENVVYKLPEIAQNLQEARQVLAPEAIASGTLLKTSCAKVTVKKGDTLEKIAKANKVKVSEMVKANNLANSFLKIGQELVIPKQNSQKRADSLDQKPKKEFIALGQPEYYTIKVGDNPYTIAVKHNLKLADVLKINNLDEKKARKLKPGDKIRIR